VDFTATTTASARVSVATTSNAVAISAVRAAGGGTLWVGEILFLLGCVAGASARNAPESWRQAARSAVLAGQVLLSASCGGGSSPPPPGGGTPPGSYHVTVNAYTVSSDPSNPATYGSVLVSLTVN
jgi:hypothetical protein